MVSVNLVDQFNRLLAPIRALLRQMATKGSIDAVDDTGPMQEVKVITGDGEVLDQLERIQPLGLTSVPEKDDEVIVLILNGDREHAIAIQVGGSSRRPNGLAEGEVAVWRDNNNKVVFKANGDIELHAEGKYKVTPDGDIELGATASVKALVNETFKALFDAHVHTLVTAGLSSSGVPAAPLPSTILTSKTKAE
jgi:phage baseplate assembly protein V